VREAVERGKWKPRLRGKKLVADDENLSHRQVFRMCDRQQRRAPSDGGETSAGAGVESQARWTAVTNDLDVAPQDAIRVASAERLHRGFLRGKPAREMDRRKAASLAIVDFPRRKNAADKTIAIPLDGRGDAVDVGRIDPKSDDVWHSVRTRRLAGRSSPDT
jgi:hypothetical protein